MPDVEESTRSRDAAVAAHEALTKLLRVPGTKKVCREALAVIEALVPELREREK